MLAWENVGTSVTSLPDVVQALQRVAATCSASLRLIEEVIKKFSLNSVLSNDFKES